MARRQPSSTRTRRHTGKQQGSEEAVRTEPSSLSERRWKAVFWGIWSQMAARDRKFADVLAGKMADAGLGRRTYPRGAVFDPRLVAPDPPADLVVKLEAFFRSNQHLSARGATRDKTFWDFGLLLTWGSVFQALKALRRRQNRRVGEREAREAVEAALRELDQFFLAGFPPGRRSELAPQFWSGIESVAPRRLALRVAAHIWRLPQPTTRSALSRARRQYPETWPAKL